MVSTLMSLCELLSSRKYDCSAFSLYQGRTEICGTFLQAEGLQGAENHMHLCAQSGDNAVLEKVCTIEEKCSGKAKQM
jgi:hypothetical protein